MNSFLQKAGDTSEKSVGLERGRWWWGRRRVMRVNWREAWVGHTVWEDLGEQFRLGRLSRHSQNKSHSNWTPKIWNANGSLGSLKAWHTEAQERGLLSEFLFQPGFWRSLESSSSEILFPLGTGPKEGIPASVHLYRNITEGMTSSTGCLLWCMSFKLSVAGITFINAMERSSRVAQWVKNLALSL